MHTLVIILERNAKDERSQLPFFFILVLIHNFQHEEKVSKNYILLEHYNTDIKIFLDFCLLIAIA